MSGVIPKTGIGWKGGESFLFEIAYNLKKLSLKFVISPGNEHNRKLLSSALQKLPGAEDARGDKWLTHVNFPGKGNFSKLLNVNDEEIVNIVKQQLEEHKEMINKAEQEILSVSTGFVTL